MRGDANVANWEVTYPEQEYIFGDFAERLWAYLTIKQLLENRLVHVHLYIVPLTRLRRTDYTKISSHVVIQLPTDPVFLFCLPVTLVLSKRTML